MPGEQPTSKRLLTESAANAAYASFAYLAKDPDSLVTGGIVRNSDGVATSANVQWPDGTTGVYTVDAIDSTGAVNAYRITYGTPTLRTYIQPTVTRDASGNLVTIPQIVVS